MFPCELKLYIKRSRILVPFVHCIAVTKDTYIDSSLRNSYLSALESEWVTEMTWKQLHNGQFDKKALLRNISR
jgi:hypothetical protein